VTKEERRAKHTAYMREYMRLPDVRERVLARRRELWAANPEKFRAMDRASKQRNRDAVLARKKRYRQMAAGKIRAYNASYSAANAGKVREWRGKWADRNPEFFPRKQRERRMAEARATPAWVDLDSIAAVYDHRAEMERLTGVEHHVDHIVPIRSPIVCGLHVPWNLQVIPAAENWSKSNRLLV